MGVNHRRLYALMAEKLLNFPDIDPLHQKVGGEAVAQGMDGRVFDNTRLFYSGPYGLLDTRVADVVTPDLAAPGINRQIGRRKNILPFPFSCSLRIFSRKGGREIYFTMPGGQVPVVQRLHPFYVEPQRLFDRLRKNGRSVFVAFAGPIPITAETQRTQRV